MMKRATSGSSRLLAGRGAGVQPALVPAFARPAAQQRCFLQKEAAAQVVQQCRTAVLQLLQKCSGAAAHNSGARGARVVPAALPDAVHKGVRGSQQAVIKVRC